ncbi:MAG: PVC-type heme-binding CxxCH protein [Gemmataceae bacterium]
MPCRLAIAAALLPLLSFAAFAEPPRLLSPKDELATFRLHPGFHAELVACEPQIVDPVAMAFDHNGRLYVCEMRGYPNDGYGTGQITSGCIKLLEDRDGDGVYETATVFADGLRFPTSIMPWKNGVLVSVAPDLIYLEDSKRDGKADVKKVLYTGFGIDNIQQLLNSLQWGLDNWVYAVNGASGGTITSPEKPDFKPVTLGNRGIRFHPATNGSLEPMSGGGQFGLAPDAFQHWFVNTNSQHLRQIILPDHYLRRNPGMAGPSPVLDIPEHGPACKVYRISPFEQWRVERTTRRATGPDSKRFPQTELVPGGYITSACSPLVYEADRYPAEYRNCVFICEPANNLILRDRLEENGPIFKATRPDQSQEFFASTDNSCRPVNLTLGPDGCIYVVDFYRPVIETPRSLPDDMKRELPLQTQNRGRIWRIVPDGVGKMQKPALGKMTSADLVPLLADENIWVRLTAQRLLVERQDTSVVPGLVRLVRTTKSDYGKVHALWSLRGLHSLDDELIVAAMSDRAPGVREQALRLAEGRLRTPSALRESVEGSAADVSPRVRFQAAFTLGECNSTEKLTDILLRDLRDPWTVAAVLSSAENIAPAMLEALLQLPEPSRKAGATADSFVAERQLALRRIAGRLVAQIGATGNDVELANTIFLIAISDRSSWQQELFDGLARGMQNTDRPLSSLWQNPPEVLKAALARLRSSFEISVRVAQNSSKSPAERADAIRRLSQGPYDLVGSVLAKLLAPNQPDAVQLAAVNALERHNDPGVAAVLLAAWPTASPVLRREIQEALFARPERLPALLDAIEAKQVRPNLLDPARVAQLRKLPNAKLRERATKLLAGAIDADRQKVVDSYKAALDLKPDVERGRALFRKTCATCHRLEDHGTEVGPDLKTNIRDKTPEQLLVAILDPSREVDRRYIYYVVETKSGRSISGVIAAETATSLTLRRAEKIDEVILRSQIESIADTGKSLMPDGLEKELDQQALADVIAYLRSIK